MQAFYIDLVRSVLGQLGTIKVDVDAGRSVNCAVDVGVLETDKGAGGVVSDHIAVRHRELDRHCTVGWNVVVSLQREHVLNADLATVEGRD